MPSEALIIATAEPRRSDGSSSRMMLIPSGITAADRPCSVRPMIAGRRLSARAVTTDPATRTTRLISSIRRLPNMSPSRPTVGVATAAASSVAVITQAVSALDAFSSVGSWGTSGMITVCISATTMPANASTATTAFGRTVRCAVTETPGTRPVQSTD